MPRTYASDVDMQDALPEYQTSDAGQNARMARFLARATSLIDEFLGYAYGSAQHFALPDDEKSTRVFRGTNTYYLPIDHIADGETIAADDVTMGSNYDTPTFVYQNGHLRIVDSQGAAYSPDYPMGEVWPYGVTVTVNAKWGWTTVPGDINQACIMIVATWWRRRRGVIDPNYPAQNPGEQLASAEIPPEAREILDRRRGRVAFAGVV